MPLVRIDASTDRSPATLRAVADGVHRALVEAIGIPADDRFQVLTTHPAAELIFDQQYLGIDRQDVVCVQITLVRGRTEQQKRELYRLIAAHLEAGAGIRPQDVLVTLTENDRADWSVGNGQAQLLS
ncbi:tautomerase family protein [Kitasatospora sp. NPDC058965]|uniref:tautomerase family protein n=1 Tax=Kitasatospora sp. NPDC058965 TaxID=3346682 RepID=UPI003679C32B